MTKTGDYRKVNFFDTFRTRFKIHRTNRNLSIFFAGG